MSTRDNSLYRACARCYKDLVVELANSDNVNYVRPSSGDTPLHQACKQGWLDVVKLLIEKYGGNPNVRNKHHESVLHYACRYGHIGIVKYLIKKRHLNPLLRNIIQLEPLDCALNNYRTDIAVYLCQHCISSDEMLNPNRIKTTINLIKYILRASDLSLSVGLTRSPWKTVNGDNILQLVGSSKTCISHVPSTVVLTILNSGSTKNIAFKPDCKTSDGDNILELACQSEIFLSQTPSSIILKWLGEATINQVKISIPGSKTADGKTLIEIVCQSEVCISHISTAVLSKWLSDTTIIQTSDLAKTVTPEWKTADGDTLLQLVCQSKTVTAISSTVLTKWLSDSTTRVLDLIVTPDLRTADGVTLFELICQSEKCLIQISSTLFFKWLKKTPLEFVSVYMPDCETANGFTLLQLILNSEMSISQTSSIVLSKLLSDSRDLPMSQMKMVDPNWKTLDGVHFLYALCWSNVEDKVIIELMQHYMQQNNLNPDIFLDSDENTVLHIACQTSKPALVSYLIDEAQYDPNIKNKAKKLPLDMTINPKIINCLCQNDQVALFSKTVAGWMTNKSIAIRTMIQILQSLIRNHRYKTKDGSTLLHVACTLNTYAFIKKSLIDYLLTDGHFDPNCLDSNGKTPLQLTSNSEIMKKLIEHGAKVTADDVFKLITSGRADSIINEMLSLSIRKQSILWNPNELNDNGYNALHITCKAENPTRVNILLSEAHCDPNIKSNNEEVPLQMTTNTKIIKDLIRHGAKTSIMYSSYQSYLGTNKPIQPPVKVFIVGNPTVGKSTLTAALKKKISIFARIFTGKVSGVDQKTVGIVPHDIESEIFGRVTLYDFAGHREFYSGHAALLQTAIQSTPPIFLLVIDLREDDDEVIQNILYWISFLENQCTSVSCKPHVILVGSHADILKGVNRPKEKVIKITDSLDTNCFTNMEYIGFVAMNCRYHESTGMNDLRRLLIKSCEELRIQEPITFNAHCFLVFLVDKFINLTAVTIKTLSEEIKNQQSKDSEDILEFLPKNIETLYKICLELNDRGHILLLKDRIATENSYIVIHKEFLLSEISGTVFAPEGFRQHTQLSTNTGVVPRSKLADSFPSKDLNIVIGFFNHLEFCHEIADQALHQLISEQYSQIHNDNERYYLFPGLISVNAKDSVWKTESNFEHNFGWTLRCINDKQFFSSRFLQVLLLRLAFSFALKISGSDHKFGIHRKCSIWKNGIFWGRNFNMDMLVEVTDSKSVNVMARFTTSNLLKCVKHRSEVLRTILECVKLFCPRIETVESYIDTSSALQYPFELNSDKIFCSVQDLCEALVSSCECPSVVLPDTGKSVPAKIFISYEPYTEIEPIILQELWDKKNEIKVVSDDFLSIFVRKASSKLNWFAKIFNDSADIPSNKDDLFQELLRWRGSEMTYKHFRQKLDQYSVFAGRNVLELAGHELSVRKEKTQISSLRLNVECERPQLHELQLLTFENGRELRIMETVATKWKAVSIAMGFNKERIELMEKDEHYKQEEATHEMFGRWLKGEHDLKPATWDILIQCLKQANLPDIAKLLSNIQFGRKKEIYIKSQEQVESPRSRMGVSTDTDTEVLQRDCGAVGSLPRLDKKALEVVEGRRGRKVRVIKSIGSQWEEVAKALDIGQEDIDVIKTRHSDNDEEASHEMLATWLEGNDGEVSWTVFTQALIDAGLLELADSLKDALR